MNFTLAGGVIKYLFSAQSLLSKNYTNFDTLYVSLEAESMRLKQKLELTILIIRSVKATLYEPIASVLVLLAVQNNLLRPVQPL
ncbi:hypothetical protein TPS_06307 [Trichinella pseudospiralis]